LSIASVLVLKHGFRLDSTNAVKMAMATFAVEHLSQRKLQVKEDDGRLSLFAGDRDDHLVGPESVVLLYLRNGLVKAGRQLSSTDIGEENLVAALKNVNLPCEVREMQEAGWKQRIEYFVFDVVLASEILKGKECTTEGKVGRRLAMAIDIAGRLAKNPEIREVDGRLRLVSDGDG